MDKRDVCIIANELSSVAHNWQLIGTCLGVDQSEIKEMEEQRLLPKKALVELITKWLSTNRRVTWNDILTALRMPLLKEECLANEIKKKVLSRTCKYIPCLEDERVNKDEYATNNTVWFLHCT